MFEIVKQLREAFGPQPTISFVAIMFLGFGVMGAGIGWVVDRTYKHQSSHGVTALPSSVAEPSVQQQSEGPGSPNIQGVKGDVTVTVDQNDVSKHANASNPGRQKR